MGLISGLLTWPIAPVRGVAWVAEQVRDEAERQWSSPAAVQRELDEVERMLADGTIDEEEAAERQEELVSRLLASSDTGWSPQWDDGEDGADDG